MKTFLAFCLGVLVVVSTAGVVEQWGSTFSLRHTAAIALVTLDQINVLRAQAGLPTVTTNQMLTALQAKYTGLENEFRNIERVMP